jgi:hypothetical protein
MWLCGINDVPTTCSKCGCGMYTHYANVDNPFRGPVICQDCKKKEEAARRSQLPLDVQKILRHYPLTGDK